MMKVRHGTGLKIHTNDNALLAYIDLLGTKALYTENLENIRSQAEKLLNACIYIFFEEFKNYFSPQEIKNNFYINVYADSIVICKRITKENNVRELLEFLLKYQMELISKGYKAASSDGRLVRKAILSRAIIGEGSYFSVHTGPNFKSFFGSDLVEVSICGGKAILDLDSSLKKLPLGIYVYNDLVGHEISSERRISVKDEAFSFIKQKQEHLNFPTHTVDFCGSTMFEHCENSLMCLEGKAKDKSEPWIAAHKGELQIIKKSC